MNFTPAFKYLSVELIAEEQQKVGSFIFDKPKLDLVAVTILSSNTEEDDLEGCVAVVYSSMIQKIEYKGQVFNIIPDSAVVGYIDEE